MGRNLSLFKSLAVISSLFIFGANVVGRAADEDLAKASQNPIGSMISLPMQNNTYFNVGPSEEWANSFRFQGSALLICGKAEEWPGLVLTVTGQTAFPEVIKAKTAPALCI